jgi:hypothetical protein
MAAKSTNATRRTSSSGTLSATAMATRVLPVPPGPVMVTSGEEESAPMRVRTLTSRPDARGGAWDRAPNILREAFLEAKTRAAEGIRTLAPELGKLAPDS